MPDCLRPLRGRKPKWWSTTARSDTFPVRSKNQNGLAVLKTVYRHFQGYLRRWGADIVEVWKLNIFHKEKLQVVAGEIRIGKYTNLSVTQCQVVKSRRR